MKEHLSDLLGQALAAVQAQEGLDWRLPEEIQIERSREAGHGDRASNIALVLAGQAGMPPRELAEKILASLPESPRVSRAEVAGPGFINFFLAAGSLQSVVAQVLEQGERFGCSREGAGRAVQVEFVSANPTGPLHVGHGRGAALGDCIARLLQATGWRVTREFYYNDSGQQVDKLARSVQARCRGLGPEDPGWPEDGYRGDYIRELAAAYLAGATVAASDQSVTAAADPARRDAIREFAVAWLRREQDLDLRAFGVEFDVFFLESSLHESGAVERTLQALASGGHSYQRDGALWLRTTAFGDDKDRVMRKRDGGYTYFLPDVAYHHDKWRRGFGRVVNEQGADHHSAVARVRAGLQALDAGIPEGWPEYVLHQMVTVTRGGEEARLSKRAGGYLTLRELIDEVGRDAARYFLAARAPGSQLAFDIDLALAQSSDNPVYYIQYAHARACSVFRKLAELGLDWSAADGIESLARLTAERESRLLKKLALYPEVVAEAARKLAPHSLAACLRALAADFHAWYNAHKMLVEDRELRAARLALSAAARQVIANGLGLLGIRAPERM